jgi:acyl-[acyl-carrier-protein] desaturase
VTGNLMRLEERLYNEYIQFFEKAERERRWNVFSDIPWDKIKKDASEETALCAETFCSVEMYLPDYVAGGINVVRKYFGQSWFQANWGYE